MDMPFSLYISITFWLYASLSLAYCFCNFSIRACCSFILMFCLRMVILCITSKGRVITLRISENKTIPTPTPAAPHKTPINFPIKLISTVYVSVKILIDTPNKFISPIFILCGTKRSAFIFFRFTLFLLSRIYTEKNSVFQSSHLFLK